MYLVASPTSQSAYGKRSVSIHELEEVNPRSPVFDPNCDAYWERLKELRETRRQEDEDRVEHRRLDR